MSNITDEKAKALVAAAQEARERAYAPYSGFCVGAALLGESGKIYAGCNVESVSFTPTCCAERTALVKAISEGEREFLALAVVGGREKETALKFCPPCGVCRQMLAEFCKEDFPVYLAVTDRGEVKEIGRFSLGQLLPLAFKEALRSGTAE